ncbi:hypothetical protein C8Q78DRAFT_949776, partial [Trametes maxima]
ADLLKGLDELREMKSLSVQSVPINSFHDVRAGMSKLFEEARQQHARTGYNLIVLGCKLSRDQLSPPMIFTTSQAVVDFFPMTLGVTMNDLVSSFEAYSLSGVPGACSCDFSPRRDDTMVLTLESRLSDAMEHTARKMFYTGFGDHITDKFGVVIENWPLPCFAAPSTLRTRIELTTLINSWETGITRFRKLTRAEWDRW